MSIQDLECFKAACEQHDVDYATNEDENFKWQGLPVQATLTDRKTGAGYRNQAYLVRSEGAFKLMIDNDANYSSITARVGKNGGKITRDYTTSVITKGVRRNGGLINLVAEQPDGSILLKISSAM